MWNKDGFNWIYARIYHDDLAWIDSWVGGKQSVPGTQMILYKDNLVEKDNASGYIGLQIHKGSGAWQINNPNMYDKLAIREIASDGAPLATYPGWAAPPGEVCSDVVATRQSAALRSLHWQAAHDGNAISGYASGPYLLTVVNLAGKTVFTARGGAGSFQHRLDLGQGVHVATLSSGGIRQSLTLAPAH